jgi:phosphomannomutase
MLPRNRVVTNQTILDTGADLGVAWDGDFDRCFFFDEQGDFVEGYYIVGLLAEAFLERSPGDKVVHDPRLVWNTVEIAERRKGAAVRSATGHALMKETMRRVDAIYGGEMSAHHYFRDFAYCDSGMIPWLLVAELMSVRKMPLSALVAERRERYPISGEINRRVDNPQDVIAKIRGTYEKQSLETDLTDGVSLEFDNWRFNLRVSNTEPLIRLNVESRANRDLTSEKTEELLALIGGEPG